MVSTRYVGAILVLLAAIGFGRPVFGQARAATVGTVTLPVADYDRLIDRATRGPAPVDAPPVPAVIGRADLRARVEGDVVRGTLRLDGEVFQRGAVKVPLVSGATLLDARADGRAIPVLSDGDLHAAVFPGPAPFSIVLDWAATLGTAPGRASFALPLAASGSTTATIDLPGDPGDVRIEPGLITSRQSAGGRTTLEVALERGKRTQVSWSVRESAAQGAAETRMLSEVKSLLTIGDGDLRLVALIDISIVRGTPRTFDLVVPPGYEVAAVTGSSLESTSAGATALRLTVRDPALRRHQFLVSLERPRAAGSFRLDTAFPSVAGVQREAGEAAIEGTGTIEVTADGGDTLRRMDVREANARLLALARHPILAAFRYQRRPNEARVLALDVKRFGDAPVIAAAAEHASATTLVTMEGRMLTEVSLTVRNRAQPFMKVALPPGATMLSVDVAGEPARPVQGSDGTRIPLLRAGFRPTGPYTVSFVYLHAGPPLARRGEVRMVLPVLDVPVTLLDWELFLPERCSAKPAAGNVLPAHIVERASTGTIVVSGGREIAGGSETVTVMADAPLLQTATAGVAEPKAHRERDAAPSQAAPSQNIINLQRRVAGVLPVRVDVPRAGTQYRFVRPLVLEEETTVSFKYTTR